MKTLAEHSLEDLDKIITEYNKNIEAGVTVKTIQVLKIIWIENLSATSFVNIFGTSRN